MLKIKEGVKLTPYGPLSEITSESELSQEVLRHLQGRYPEDIEGEYEEEKHTAQHSSDAPKAITKAALTKMAERVKADTATQEERDIVAAAKEAGKL